jgi:hypothetical protein
LLLLAKKAVLISGISESENKKYYAWREKIIITEGRKQTDWLTTLESRFETKYLQRFLTKEGQFLRN